MSAASGRMVVMARVRVGRRTFYTPSYSVAPSASVEATAAKFRELYLADAVVEFRFLPASLEAPPL